MVPQMVVIGDINDRKAGHLRQENFGKLFLTPMMKVIWQKYPDAPLITHLVVNQSGNRKGLPGTGAEDLWKWWVKNNQWAQENSMSPDLDIHDQLSLAWSQMRVYKGWDDVLRDFRGVSP